VYICEDCYFHSDYTDYDYWEDGSGNYEFPLDTLTYNWSATGGTWVEGANTQQDFEWTAPPITDFYFVSLTVDDLPDEMDNPCAGSNRDDEEDMYGKWVHTMLPGGCEVASVHDSSIHWLYPDDDYQADLTGSGCWGYYGFAAGQLEYDVDLKYNNGFWVCEISNVKPYSVIKVWASNRPGYANVETASDVPCEPSSEPEQAIYDLLDISTSDDIGPPFSYYWCHSAVVVHEEKHRSDWETFYTPELAAAIAKWDGFHVEIDCDEINTIHCLAARDQIIYDIEYDFYIAYDLAYLQFDNPNTPIDESEQRAYNASALITDEIVLELLLGGCGE